MGGKKAIEKNREWEKGRRDKLNQSFSELSKLLPDHDPSITLSKMEVLNRAAMYIKTLQQQNQDILKDGKQTFLDEEVDRLQKRVAHLVFKTKLLVDALRNAGVPIPDTKPHKSKNRKKQDKKLPMPDSRDNSNKPNISGVVEEEPDKVVPQTGIMVPPEKLIKETLKSPKTCVESHKVLDDKMPSNNEKTESPEPSNKTKEFIKVCKEPLKEINSTLPSVNIPKDTASVSQAPQAPLISAAVKEQPLLTGSIPGVITSINQNPSTTVPNFTFFDRSLVNLGPGTLILADGRVVNVPPPMPQIVVKPPPTLILMQKTVRREKRLYPKPKQVDITKTTFTNKAPIPTIKHINFEFKTKRSRIKVTKTRLSPKQIKRKEPPKSKVVSKSHIVNDDKFNIDSKKTEIDNNYSTSAAVGTQQKLDKGGEVSHLINEDESRLSKPSSESKESNRENKKGEKSVETVNISSQIIPDDFIPDKNLGFVNNGCANVDSEAVCLTEQNEPNLIGSTDKSAFDHVQFDNIDPPANERRSVENDFVNTSRNPAARLTPVNDNIKDLSHVNILETVESCTGCDQQDDSGSVGQCDILNSEMPKDTSDHNFSGKRPFSKSDDRFNNNKKDTDRSEVLSDPVKDCFGNSKETTGIETSTDKKVSSGHSLRADASDLEPFINPCGGHLMNSSLDPSIEAVPTSFPETVTPVVNKDPNKNVGCNSSNNNVLEKSIDKAGQSHKTVETETVRNSSVNTTDKSAPSYKRTDHYFNGLNLNAIGEKTKEFFSPRHEPPMKTFDSPDDNFNRSKMNFETQNNLRGSSLQTEKYNRNDGGILTCKDKRLGNNCGPTKDSFHIVPTGPTPDQNLNSRPFVVHKDQYSVPDCLPAQMNPYTSNCNVPKEQFNHSDKSLCKDIYGNYTDNSLNKSCYNQDATLNKDPYANQCESSKSCYADMRYSHQYSSVTAASFMNHTNSLYGNKEVFGNQCKPSNKEFYINHESSAKDPYVLNRTLNKDHYINQNNSIGKNTFTNQNLLIKEPARCSDSLNSLGKETFGERSLQLSNQCNTLGKEYSEQSAQLTNRCNSLSKEFTERSAQLTNQCNSLSKDYNERPSQLTNPCNSLSKEYSERSAQLTNQCNSLSKEFTERSAQLTNQCNSLSKDYNERPSQLTNPCNSLSKEYSERSAQLTNQCNSLSKDYNERSTQLTNPCNSLSKEYSERSAQLTNQCNSLSKDYNERSTQLTNPCNSLSKEYSERSAQLSNQCDTLNKDFAERSMRLTNRCDAINKDFGERSIPITNQCSTLNKDSFVTVNKDCYTGISKDSYNNRNSCVNISLTKDSYDSNVSVNKSMENTRMNTSNKESSVNRTAVQRHPMNKPPFENQKSMTADKACQPEIPMCLGNTEYMEVMGRNAMRTDRSKEVDASASVRLAQSENRIGMNNRGNTATCSVNNTVAYNSSQNVTNFGNVSDRNDMTFNRNSQKSNKNNTYKSNGNVSCKYTIDSLFKNGDIDAAAQVSIARGQDKVSDNRQNCKNILQKRNSGQYDLEGLPLSESAIGLNQNQIYQGENNQYSLAQRSTTNMCSNIIDSDVRNDLNLTNNGCNLVQQTSLHDGNNGCKNSGNPEKNNQNNKIYNSNGEMNYNKNDSIMISSNELIKSKELDRNNFMPLLDDVRLTTDFSSDLFSSFQVTPGGQHPESMSPTAAFLLAFPLVSTSKTADNNENDNPEHNSSTPTTILQIGNIDQPNPDLFQSQVDSIRTKPVDDSNKDYERYAAYDSGLYDNVQVENAKRKSSQNQNFTDQSNNCVDKSYRRNCDTRKRSRNQSELPLYSQSYTYPIFPNNNDFTQFANPNAAGDPKSDALSVPWAMNLNQDFGTQTMQKDACTSTKSVKSNERKNSKNDKHQSLKGTSYSCNQQGSQNVEYYISKPERKKQKTSHSKTPINWMAPSEPVKNTFVEPPLSQIEMYSNNNKEQDVNLLSNNQGQNMYNNIVSSLEVPFDTMCFSDFGNKKSNNYSWSPNKSLLPTLDNHNFVIPSTLPTLVGDLALGTSTPAETFKSFEDGRKFDQPKKADKSSSTFLDNAGVTTSLSTTTKKRVDFNTKAQANSNSFLSVSQLVDPKSQKQSKINEIKQTKRNDNNKDKFQNCQVVNNRRNQEQNCIYNQRNEIPLCWNDKQQKNQYKGNYSAESLIGVQPPSETAESFHLNFNNYQAQSNYFHGDFPDNNQPQQGQQYQNYFNQGASHFPSFLGDEYVHEFTTPSTSQRKKKTKDSDPVYNSGIHAKAQETFAAPLQKDNSGYLNALQKDAGGYQAPGLLGQGYTNCIKTSVPYGSQNTNTTSTLTNFNLSTIFPEINDQRVSGGASQAPHINPNFTSLPIHNYPPH